MSEIRKSDPQKVRNEIRLRTSLAVGLTLFLGTAVFASSGGPDPNCDPYYSAVPVAPTTWNGKSIFLSPAHHGNTCQCPVPKLGCFEPGTSVQFDENSRANQNAFFAANFGDFEADPPTNISLVLGLAQRGYLVRVGQCDATTNKNQSNSWDPDAHVPIHSNAHVGTVNPAASYCAIPTTVDLGTRVFHFPSSSQGMSLANAINDALGPLTPGTNDAVIATSNFIALSQTTAPAAYVEVEFHSYGPGVAYMTDKAF